MNLSRIRRLVQLIGFLQAGKGQNVNVLAELCDVSRRTIFRDLEILRRPMCRCCSTMNGGCSIPGTSFLSRTNFTAEEALAVTVLCYELGGNNRLPFYQAALSGTQAGEQSA